MKQLGILKGHRCYQFRARTYPCVGFVSARLYQLLCVLLLWTSALVYGQDIGSVNEDLLVLTVATKETEGYLRFVASAKREEIPVKTMGMNEVWTGGNHLIELLRDAMEEYKDKTDLVVMYADSYDVMFIGGKDDILRNFESLDANIVFSADAFYRIEDITLVDKFPDSGSGKRYLNSGCFIGYAPEMHRMIYSNDITDEEDDQLFFTKIYINQTLRKLHRIQLDSRSAIFHNLHGVPGELRVTHVPDTFIENIAYNTKPSVLHGNRDTKHDLNNLSNYIAGAWSQDEGCQICSDRISLEDSNLPTVFVGIFIERPTPFFKEFLGRLTSLNYPKGKMTLFIWSATGHHDEEIEMFLDNHRNEYNIVIEENDEPEWNARNDALQECLESNSDFYFHLSSIVHIENPSILRHLIAKDRLVIAPLVYLPESDRSNFEWMESFQYEGILLGKQRGIWNVPFVSYIYLLKREVLINNIPTYTDEAENLDYDLCRQFSENDVFLYLDNLEDFGFLVNPENFNPLRKHPDLYEIISNKFAWEERYIAQGYYDALKPETEVLQPCPDVYWFPIVSPTFCKHIIELMEDFGKWHNGSHEDDRVEGGYEDIPLRDIHVKQVSFESQWVFFVNEYIKPIQEKVFVGYSEPLVLHLGYVARYKPDEQPFVKPHHDATTLTVNIALNQVNEDFIGGGTRFIRHNCSVTSSPPGWAIMHPGKLTHYHEGLATLNGTRYILVSLIHEGYSE